MPGQSPRPASSLTAREREVLERLRSGMTPMEIANELVLSLDTMRTHVKHLHEKTGTHNLGALLAWRGE